MTAYLAAASLAAPPALCQNELDLAEADARERAYNMIGETAERYDCEFEEYSLEEIGVESNSHYLMVVRTKGSDCSEAMWYLTTLADRDGGLLFRERPKQPIDNPDGPLIPVLDQDLIYEVNPDIEDVPED